MNYIFFDIECSDGIHICEFGYVITDEKANIIEKGDITVNPKAQFYQKRKGPALYYDMYVYKKSPDFCSVYDRLQFLLESKNVTVFGFSIQSDITYLRNACERYKMPFMSFKFVDIQKPVSMYVYGNMKVVLSLSDAAAALGLKGLDKLVLHKSSDDAQLSAEVAGKLCKLLNCDLDGITSVYRFSSGYTNEEGIFFDKEEIYYEHILDKLVSGEYSDDDVDIILSRLARSAAEKHKHKNIIGCMTGKRVCFNEQLEYSSPVDVVKLFMIVSENGGIPTRSTLKCNIFIIPDESVESEQMNMILERKKEKENSVKLYTLDSFLDEIGISFSDIVNVPLPDPLYFLLEKNNKYRAQNGI